jgi:hypothetical protein
MSARTQPGQREFTRMFAPASSVLSMRTVTDERHPLHLYSVGRVAATASSWFAW